ncbi:MAG: 2-vinyl bacteriochlorophyllide hydratase, partial [Methylobacterium sp.]|nr:2-vinyl bacteriochlorophyllide hydratase [Methylobacterium sp.]
VVVLGNLAGPQVQMGIALAAYATYVVNAAQFLLKLRAARLQAESEPELTSEGFEVMS